MVDQTRSAHLELLARAKTALAPLAETSGAISDLIVDIEAAIGQISQTIVPWPVPVYLAMIGHCHGTSVAAAVSHKGLLDQIAAFCRSQWNAINDDRDPASLDDSIVVRDYFNRHPEDQLISRMEWIEPDLGYDPEHLEIGNYLALSSSHLSWRTTLKIDAWMRVDPSDRPVNVVATHYGWFICAELSSFGDHMEIPDDLFHALTFARDRGCNYLILDRDASTTDRLPCFAW